MSRRKDKARKSSRPRRYSDSGTFAELKLFTSLDVSPFDVTCHIVHEQPRFGRQVTQLVTAMPAERQANLALAASRLRCNCLTISVYAESGQSFDDPSFTFEAVSRFLPAVDELLETIGSAGMNYANYAPWSLNFEEKEADLLNAPRDEWYSQWGITSDATPSTEGYAGSGRVEEGQVLQPSLGAFALRQAYLQASESDRKLVIASLTQEDIEVDSLLALCHVRSLTDDHYIEALGETKAMQLVRLFREVSGDTALRDFIEELSSKERESLLNTLEQAEHAELQELVFGDKNPTLARFNRWLKKMADTKVSNEEKPRIAKATQYFRNALQAKLLYGGTDPSNITECTITTERNKTYSVRFRLCAVGAEQETLYAKVAFPPLTAKP